MGLLLSVLVVCVGVLEVLACVRHFQDGYLPLWTPHCAVTSGYTASYERWRKKPSGSFQFSSFDDASGPLNLIEDQSSENCLDTSRSTQNGITGKQIDDAKENSNPSADYCCHQSKSDSGNGLSPFIDDNKREVDYHNTSDFLASPLVSDEGDLKKIHNNISNVLPSNERVSAISYSEHKTSQETSAPEFTCDLIREERAVNSSSHGGVLKSHAQSETSAPPFTSALDFKSEDQFSHVIGIEKYPISTREIEIQNEVPILSTGVKLQSPPSALITEQSFESDSHAGILSGKHPTQDDCISRTEAGLKIPSSNLYTEKSSDTVRDVSFNGVGRHDQVFSFEDEPNIPVSKSVAEESSIAVKELYQVPNTEIQHETSPSDFEVEEPSITVGEFEGEIPTSIAETNIPSSDLKIQDDKSILGCAAGRASSECGEIFYKQLDTTVPSIENESAVPSSVLNPELRFQNSLISSLASAETSITPVEASTENAVKILNDQRISNISDSVPFSPSELVDAQKGYPGSNTYIETETCLPEENTGQHLRTDTRNETEALNSQVEAPSSTYDTKNTTKIEEGLEVSQRPITEKHLDLQEDSTGSQHDSLGPRIEPHTFSPNLQSESQIITNEYTKQNVSESCLDPQTTLTDLVTSRNGGTPHDDRGFHDTSYLAQPDVRNEIPDLQTTSFTSVTPLTIDTSFESPISGSPLTFDTSFETAGSVTPLPTDHQPSVSPPKLPSTPKKSKADISWPTFFPGTPVIKRPSVSFATPEAIFADEYQELLRQHVEEVFTHPPVKDSDDISTRTEPETTTSTSEEKSSEEKSVGTPERSESFEENPDPIIYREKSPSNIVSGNDFSKKELKLQRRRSYKQKRYNSATEISTRDEQAEDRSFSENNPGVTRASSLREPKKRHKITPKASSFEDIILRDIKTEDAHLTNTAEESADVSIPEDRETEREEPQKEQPEVVEGTQEISDVTDCPRIPAERNEPKLGESKPQGEEKAIGKREDAEGSKEEEVGGDDEYSFSEDQSSSQQKSPPTEAFWVSSEEGPH